MAIHSEMSGQAAQRFDLDFDRDPRLLSLVADSLGVGVFTVDASGHFVAWSRGAEELTGHRATEVRGSYCGILDGPDCKGFSGLASLLSSAQPDAVGIDRQECRIRSAGGRELHLLGSARVLRDEEGQVYGAIAVFSDLTEILRLNAPSTGSGVEATALGGLVGTSSSMQEVFRKIRLAAASDVTTLISGESGTGKELCARAIHDESERREQPFVAVNCSAIPESLLESELFGHVKGAFTGAIRDHRGYFEAANGGTLLLDEIGEVSSLLQVKLLRVLQEREVQRIGDESKRPVDVRILTATHRDLRAAVAEGRVREDFFYRIRVFEIPMPALRDRPGDIALLANHFTMSFAPVYGKTIEGIAQDALETLVRYPWPGNVRELRNTIEHALVVSNGPTIGLLDLPEDVRGAGETRAPRTLSPGETALTADQEAERLRILQELDARDWNRTKTAEALGVSRVTLWKKIRRYGIDEGIFRRASPRRGPA